MRLSPLLLAVSLSAAVAAPLPEPSRTEVNAVLDRLAGSGCQFERNGSWYSGTEAKAHLLKKLAYIEDKTSLQTAEAFIETAATRSSLSGRAYKVRCGSSAPSDSGPWLRTQLQEIRTKGGRTAAPSPAVR